MERLIIQNVKLSNIMCKYDPHFVSVIIYYQDAVSH